MNTTWAISGIETAKINNNVAFGRFTTILETFLINPGLLREDALCAFDLFHRRGQKIRSPSTRRMEGIKVSADISAIPTPIKTLIPIIRIRPNLVGIIAAKPIITVPPLEAIVLPEVSKVFLMARFLSFPLLNSSKKRDMMKIQ